jgi:hypothetical protein
MALFLDREVIMGRWDCSWCVWKVVLLFVGIHVVNGSLGGLSPAVAAITQNTLIWESPVDNQEISGIQLVRGFAYSDTATEIVISLTIGGIPFEVPWGSARGDVGASDPQLHSGFGITINAGLFAPGQTTATLELREGTSTGPCAAPSCVSIKRTFLVVKPGARSGDPAGQFEFLNSLSPAGDAVLAVDPATGEIIVAPVTVQDSGAGGTRQATLRLLWLQNSQSFATVAASSDTSFASVQAIFSAKCAVCHTGGGTVLPASLNLNANSAFNSLVARKSTEDPSRFLANPGDDESSYLYQKVIANGNIVPGTSRMPQGCSGSSCLSESEIAAIETWLNGGAPPPQP